MRIGDKRIWLFFLWNYNVWGFFRYIKFDLMVMLCFVHSESVFMTFESKVTQLCSTLCNPMDCSLLGSSVHGIFQARILEWIAISFSRGSFQLRDLTQISCFASRLLTIWATREPMLIWNLKNNLFSISYCGQRSEWAWWHVPKTIHCRDVSQTIILSLEVDVSENL